jgi:hypothetical protein
MSVVSCLTYAMRLLSLSPQQESASYRRLRTALIMLLIDHLSQRASRAASPHYEARPGPSSLWTALDHHGCPLSRFAPRVPDYLG